MLKLIYNVKCGFKELFMTEKNLEYDLSDVCNSEVNNIDDIDELEFQSEEAFYEVFKDDNEAFETYLSDTGILDCIEDMTLEDYAHSYFKEICFGDSDHPFFPGYFEMTDLRLVYDPSIKVEYALDEHNCLAPKYSKAFLKAKDVLAILNITRPTLCKYVKQGKILVDTNYSGKQYRYNTESVYKLRDSWKEKK